jgi:hypothetical protein
MNLIARLVRRPVRRDRALPMLCLVRGRPQADVMGGLLHERIVAASPRRVPNAYVDVEGLEDERDLRGLLVALCRQLGLDNHGFRPIEFRHFPLVTWLMDQNLGDITVDQPAELVRQLRTRLGRSWLDLVGEAGERSAPGGLHAFGASLLRALVPPALFRARISGRIPSVGREFRWCMRQRYVVPRLSGSFPGFGVRLTQRHRSGEEADQVDRLLVHAFLQDLRVAYGRRPWRPGDWRRTSYPVAMLDNVTSQNGGGALLRLVNAVRNETGQFDPLLIVAAGEQVPDRAVLAGSVDLAHAAETGHQTWEQLLREARRRLDRFGWYLPIRVPEPSGGPLRPLPISPDPPPWWARRLLPVLLAAALCLSGGGWAASWAGQQQQEHCGAAFTGSGVGIELAANGECIGYSDSARYVFRSQAVGGEAELMQRLQREIFSLNAQAESLHAQPEYAGLPIVTLIYLAQLAIPVSYSAIAADEREELEGIAIRQYRLLNLERPYRAPLLRVILANAGTSMHYAPQVADMLRPLVASDPSIIGVLGFDESRRETVQAIQELNAVGLPMIAPTLSADGLELNSQLYFQIPPANLREAELMARYAASRHYGQARIIFTETPGDLYTTTLRADLAGTRAGGSGSGVLGQVGIVVDAVVDWQERGVDMHQLVCSYPGVIFYTGRAEDFDQFEQQVAKCGSTPPLNPIIGDDSVSRYMASTQERRVASDYPLVYASKAGLTSCSQADLATNPTWSGFLNLIREQPWMACSGNAGLGPMGERVALAYDATDAFVQAVETLHGIPVSGGAVWQRLGALEPYDGISGLVDFRSQVQTNHWLALVAVDHVNDLPDLPTDPARVVYHCGWVNAAAMRQSSPNCMG